jgi:hypothetical protein
MDIACGCTPFEGGTLTDSRFQQLVSLVAQPRVSLGEVGLDRTAAPTDWQDVSHRVLSAVAQRQINGMTRCWICTSEGGEVRFRYMGRGWT